MKASALPWAITITAKNGKEITDANGMTVAKLTALDIPNAELIIRSVNAFSGIKRVTNPEELVANAEYWLVPKQKPLAADFSRTLAMCKSHESGDLYFQHHIWASKDNNQAMEKWDIFGPVPSREAPDFSKL